MAKPPAPETPLPSREEILAFIARERAAAQEEGRKLPDKIGKREIARAFGLKGADKIPLKRILKELEAEGAVEKRGRTLHKKGQLPTVVLADITGRDADGELIARPVEWNEEENGATPRIAVYTPRKARPGEPAAGVGDRALIRAEPNRDARKGEPQYTGRVVKLLAKTKPQQLGVFRALPQGGGLLLPIDKKNLDRELTILPVRKATRATAISCPSMCNRADAAIAPSPR